MGSKNGAGAATFGVQHYTGKVRYEEKGLIVKCKDYLSKNVIECLQKSGDHFVADLFSFMPLPNGSYSNVRIRSSNKTLSMFSSVKVEDCGNKSIAITKKILKRIKNIPNRFSSSRINSRLVYLKMCSYLKSVKYTYKCRVYLIKRS